MASVNSLISDIQKLSGNLDLPREKSAHIAHAYTRITDFKEREPIFI